LLFAFSANLANHSWMTEPLAILYYEKPIPGSQLVNRLQDLGYRVQILSEADALPLEAERAKPMVVLADLHSGQTQVLSALTRLRQNADTTHIPVIAFSASSEPSFLEVARQAGATLVVTEAAITHHLPQLLNQALTEF
jgi:CheY-like chemotaxis protein